MINRRLIVLLFVICTTAKGALAAQSPESHLVGKIVSFDVKTVSIKSGSKTYQLQKSDLNFPSYKVGDQIEFDLPPKMQAGRNRK